MKALIQNFRAAQHAEIEISPIALLCGVNGAGKTSIARAIAAAATGQAIPYDKIAKKDTHLILRHGTHAGKVALGDDAGVSVINWVKTGSEIHTEGKPPYASPIAAGLVDFMALPAKEALAYLIRILKAEPTVNDLQQHFDVHELHPDLAGKVWETITAQGWEGAHDRAKTRGQEFKGAWQQITGETYGSKKAENWRPKAWEDTLEGVDDAKIADAIAENRKELENEIARSAVSASERERLQKLVEAGKDAKDKSGKIAALLIDKVGEISRVNKEISQLPNTHAKVDYSCPHCENLVHITPTATGKFAITKAAKLPEAEAKEAALKLAGLSGSLDKLEQEKAKMDAEWKDYEGIIKAGDAAAEALTEMGEPGEGADQQKIQARRVADAKLRERERMLQQINEAAAKSTQINVNQTIIDALAETGLRKKKLSDCLDSFMSGYLENICADFGIPQISIDSDMNVDLGKTPYIMLSKSEQFRVNTSLQMAIAKLEGAALVIVDGADILDRDGRKGLFNVLQGTGMPAVVGMTLDSPEKAPVLQDIGIGTTYWIEHGNCTPVSEQRRAA
jgi:hypothetical protein